MSSQPAWVCGNCGLKYGRRTNYDTFLPTWHNGRCGVCQAETAVTEPSDFGYLKFENLEVTD